MKKYLIFSIFIMLSISIFAQYDSLWSKTYGGGNSERCNSVIETSDSAYLLGGRTESYGAGNYDFWIVKTDMNGNTLWSKTHGGGDNDVCSSVTETSDSCYLLGGYTESYGAGAEAFWLIKTDLNGDTIWTKTYGGSSWDYCNSVIETSDSCYLLVGATLSYGAGNFDYWIVKTDMNGDTIWTKTFGGGYDDRCTSVIETSDSCYLFAGYKGYSAAGSSDYWLIKTDINGDTLWTKTYSRSSTDYCTSVIETSDSSYLLAGGSLVSGAFDYWLVKTDLQGDTIWTKTYGGANADRCNSLIETRDSCYIMAGYSSDFLIIKTDMNGDTLWTRTSGGVGGGACYSAIETSDSSYLLGGSASNDFWLAKMAYMVPDEFSIIPNYDYISLDSTLLNWHASYSKGPFSYELSFNNALDTLPQSDTSFVAGSLTEGQYIWYVTALSDFGYRTESNNKDTFWVDKNPPVVFAVEEIEDTSYSGPYELRVMAEDTIAGIDSIAIIYILPGDSVLGRVLTTQQAGLWHTGYIPEATQTGYAYYYLKLYDRAVPSNSIRQPAYPELYSFKITGLTGIVGNTQKQYALSIRQLDNTSVNLTLPKDSPVNISVYDISGRSVLSKVINLPAGASTVNLNINPGVYFIKINTPYGNHSGKIINMK